MCVGVPDDKEARLNTAIGLLDWKTRCMAWVTVRTVYSKKKWASRRLGPQELGHTMDLPGDKIEGMSAEVLDKVVLSGSVPGKLMVLVAGSLEITESGESAFEPERDRKQKSETDGPQDKNHVKSHDRGLEVKECLAMTTVTTCGLCRQRWPTWHWNKCVR
jgi:hypothetical protein